MFEAIWLSKFKFKSLALNLMTRGFSYLLLDIFVFLFSRVKELYFQILNAPFFPKKILYIAIVFGDQASVKLHEMTPTVKFRG